MTNTIARTCNTYTKLILLEKNQRYLSILALIVDRLLAVFSSSEHLKM